MVHGPAGCGKSTFASGAPDALFIDAERRTGHLDVARVEPDDWDEILAMMSEVIKTKPCQTLVFDTLDHMEVMLWQSICRKDGSSTMAKACKGYGKAYDVAQDAWNLFMVGIDKLTSVGITPVMLAHSEIKVYKNPTGEDYDRYQVKLHQKAQWAILNKLDVAGFATFEDFVRASDGPARAKAITTGERVLKFAHAPAYYTKVGLGLPDELPLKWAAFAAALTAPQS